MIQKLKKEIVAVFLVIIILMGILFPINVKATTIEEESNEIVYISNEEELKEIGKTNEFKYYSLSEDIEINENWEPINGFTGILDGNGHTIKFNINLDTVNLFQTLYLGLFASCTNATIKNLYVDGNISLTTGSSLSNPNVYVGGIVASATNAKLENVHFSGNVSIATSTDNSSWVGGLIGIASNTQISLCSNTANITAKIESTIGITKAGGLCGEFSGTIENSYNTGDILATAISESSYAGGLIGYNTGDITRSYNSGNAKAEGSSFSLSDIYAGGIAALGEIESSITNCAVMSSEISVVEGWINTGYKYIIANGGSKSNNISINNITGSPVNDSNFQYTQAELKTKNPYIGFDFYNTWNINENINDGYPYHDKNIYAINISYQDIPEGLKIFIDDGYIGIQDVKQTDDGFTLCTKSLKDILSNMGIEEIKGNGNTLSLEDLDSWYIYNIGTSYSILKMRGIDPKRSIGTSIPFMEFDIDLINLFYEDIMNQVEQSENEEKLYTALDNLIYGKVDSNYTYSVPIVNYFCTITSKANYLIAEEYIRKILENERDANGYIQVPSNITPVQENFLNTLPNIYDSENSRIKVKNYNLTNFEKRAILACRTGNISLNIYAAENIAHAQVTELLGEFLQGIKPTLDIEKESEDGSEPIIITITRNTAEDWFSSSIKSDAGIAEESVPKEIIAYELISPILLSTFGNI